MTKQILFILSLLVTIGIFSYTVRRVISFFQLTTPAFKVANWGKRFMLTMEVAMGQTKIFRRPFIGFVHALVFWGFCVILVGSVEMIIDGMLGIEKSLAFLGPVYSVITGSGDIFSIIVGLSILLFLFRRLFLPIKRFEGIEMTHFTHIDANIALSLIFLLMLSLTWMNVAYCSMHLVSGIPIEGFYPVGMWLGEYLRQVPFISLQMIYEICWWSHILLIFLFANLLPYSKHFHVFMSVPNVFLSRLDPLGKLPNMDSVTKEVRMMLDPNASFSESSAEAPALRFGVKDCEDVSWKNYFDSLACTQCGRCTAACPANITGKKLSPRKIIMNVRARMNEKGPGLVKNGKAYNDHKSLLRSYITEEELWACTACQACAKECPININHPTLIVDMRRYLVMEEGSAPGGLKTVFNNIENNGAPWQFSSEDRLLWAKDLTIYCD
jgi:heterodisulfide reductase subunit C